MTESAVLMFAVIACASCTYILTTQAAKLQESLDRIEVLLKNLPEKIRRPE
jgi:hypothetical protein